MSLQLPITANTKFLEKESDTVAWSVLNRDAQHSCAYGMNFRAADTSQDVGAAEMQPHSQACDNVLRIVRSTQPHR